MNFYQSLKNPARNLLATAVLLATLGAQAQAVWDMADMPLLAGNSTVAPNLIFMFDDSGSMIAPSSYDYPDCMDAYNLKGRFGANPPYIGRNCNADDPSGLQRTPFDLSTSQTHLYADPSRLSGTHRDLRTLVTYSYTFNPMYYNPNMRYVPWPGYPNANPLAARPLATNPTALATSTFNLINNAPLRRSMVNGQMKVNYVNATGTTVPFPPGFPSTFKSNNVTPHNPTGYITDTRLEPTNGPKGGALHDAFSDTHTVSPNWPYQRLEPVVNPISTFFLAQYTRFTGDPLVDANVTNMDNYETVKIDNPTTAFPPSGNKSVNRTDCVALTNPPNKCSLSEEQTNFANWFSYYKTKGGMAMGTVAQAFANLPGNFRVGWGQLSKVSSSIDGQNSAFIVQGVRRWDETITVTTNTTTTTKATKEHFRDWIAKMGASGDTKLREELEAVGTYFKRTDNAGPWGNSPGNSADTTAQLGCRRNYHVAITDGAWSTFTLGTSRGNVDGNNQGSNYIASKPYSDAWSNTLADISMHYWANDLRSDMTNNVSATPSDPATWQHLTNYYLMLNMTKSIDGDSAADMLALTNGTKTWPDPSLSGLQGGMNKIDDTLHAAINSRGKLFRVTGPLSVVDALLSIKRDMTNTSGGSDAQVAVSGEYLTGTSKKFKPSYSVDPWGGISWPSTSMQTAAKAR